jgi:hypothetical protein
MTRDEFLTTIQEAISQRATLQDDRFHIERASGDWTRTYRWTGEEVRAINHKGNWQDQKPDTYSDADALFDDLWEYSDYDLEAQHYMDGDKHIARPKIIDPDRTEPIYAKYTERVIERVRRGELDPEVVDMLDSLPHHLEADDTGRVYHVAPEDEERYELSLEVDPINQPA